MSLHRVLKAIVLALGLIGFYSSCQSPSSTNSTGGSTQTEGPFYEVYLPFWSSENPLQALAADIFRIRNLYFKTIVISPVQPVSQLMVLGELGSPFAIQNHRKIRDIFGSKEDFQALVDSVHKYDMQIVMDWFPAVIGRDHIWKDYGMDVADSLAYNPYNLPFRDVLLLDYTQNGVTDSMAQAMHYWYKEFDLDGFRVFDDESVPDDLYTQLKKKTPITLIRSGDKELTRDNFNFYEKNEFAQTIRLLLKDSIDASDMGATCSNLSNAKNADQSIHYLGNYFLMNKEGSIPNSLGSSYRSMFILSLLCGGDVLLPGGLELPVVKNMSIVRNQQIKWDRQMDDDFYRQLLILRSRNRALQSGQDVKTRIIPTNQPTVLAIEKTDGSHKAVIIVNLQRSTVGVKFGENIFNFNDFITQRPVSIRSDATFNVGPYQYYVLTNV